MLQFCVTLQWHIFHVAVLCDVTVTYIPCCSSVWRYSDIYPMLQYCVTLQWHISHVAVLCDVTVTYIPCCSSVWRNSDIYSMFQFCVTLQSEETVSEECRKKGGQGSSLTSYVRHQDMCLHTLKSHFSVPVPLTATPGFITDIGM